MWIKFTADYIAGAIAGAGLIVVLLSLTADSDLLKPDFLTRPGTIYAGLAMLLAGGGMKLRAQQAAASSDTSN